MNDFIKEKRMCGVNIWAALKNHPIKLTIMDGINTKLVANDTIDLIDFMSESTMDVHTTEDLQYFWISSRFGYNFGYKSFSVAGCIAKHHIFLQEERSSNAPKRMLLSRSSYPIIIDLLQKIAAHPGPMFVDEAGRLPLEKINDVIVRWWILRLLFLGAKDPNSLLSRLPIDVIRYIRFYIDDKYYIVQYNNQKKLKREQERQAMKKRKICEFDTQKQQ